MRLCRYCMRLSLVLASALSCAMSRLIGLAGERFRCDQTGSTGLSSEAYGGSWKTVSQSRAATSAPPSCWCAASGSQA